MVFDQSDSPWCAARSGFDPNVEPLLEALCTTGNGYFATRGAAPDARADGVHYPGTYVAGVYNRLTSDVDGHAVSNESLVNVPNWLDLTFRLEDGEWFNTSDADFIDYHQVLDLRGGVLIRRFRMQDSEGRRIAVSQRRLTSMADAHVAAIEMSLVAENWSGRLYVRSGLDGDVRNEGVERYRGLPSRHLEVPELNIIGEQTKTLVTRTTQSNIEIAMAARTRVTRDGEVSSFERHVIRSERAIAQVIELDVRSGEPVTVEKLVAVFTSRDAAISNAHEAAVHAVAQLQGFAAVLHDHQLHWEALWQRTLLRMDSEVCALMIRNLHVFHLLQTISAHSIDLDVGAPARGLHGEAYRGHIFWDELFVFPFLNTHFPDLGRAMLMYRRRRLPQARAAAKAAGFSGAMFPWQSGSDGSEQTQTMHLNPQSGRWLPDNSHIQRHVNAAIAYNLWTYFLATDDLEFMVRDGFELLLEIALFWSSITQFDPNKERFVIRGVMGPDEYHDAMPQSDRPGVDNNAYTNVMATWVLARALEALDQMPRRRAAELREQLHIDDDELERWRAISTNMYVPFHGDSNELISQFEGYDELVEFDWDGYRDRYSDVRRLDRILEAEGDSPNNYKLSKQADVLMLLFLFSSEELCDRLGRLGYDFDPRHIPDNVDYYTRRSADGSSLSRVVESWVRARSNRPGAWTVLTEALESDVSDVQGGTTEEGIHLGAMAGTVDILERAFTGIEVRGGTLRVNPQLPGAISELELAIQFRHHWDVHIRIHSDGVRVTVPPSDAPPILVDLWGTRYEIAGGESREVRLPTPVD